MQISKKFYFLLILYLMSGKVTKCVLEKLSASKFISHKHHGVGGGVGGGKMFSQSAFRVKAINNGSVCSVLF